MRSWLHILLLATLLASICASVARAQPVLSQRCNNDTLVGAAAEARVNWARRCSLVYRVNNPAAWFDLGIPAANGGTLKEYQEYDTGLNFWGENSWSGQVYAYEINYSATVNVYLSAATSQFTDALGYYRWERPLNRKRVRPIYPIYGNSADYNSPTSRQIFPHPTDPNDCFFYFDKQGTVPATGSFYLNAYCEPSGMRMGGEGDQGEADLDADELEALTRLRTEELGYRNRLTRYKMLPRDLVP